MKIENISELIYAFIRNDKERISRSFETCIACEKEGNTKYRLKRAFDEYKQRQGIRPCHPVVDFCSVS